MLPLLASFLSHVNKYIYSFFNNNLKTCTTIWLYFQRGFRLLIEMGEHSRFELKEDQIIHIWWIIQNDHEYKNCVAKWTFVMAYFIFEGFFLSYDFTKFNEIRKKCKDLVSLIVVSHARCLKLRVTLNVEKLILTISVDTASASSGGGPGFFSFLLHT